MRRRSPVSTVCPWLALVLAFGACSSEPARPGPTDASTIADDAAPVDSAVPDPGAPAAPGELGGACCVQDACDEVVSCTYPMGACHEDSWGTPGGMCTVWCEAPDDPVCPEGSRCGCTPDAGPCACIYDCDSDDDCRVDEGYRCCPGEGCMPAGWDCA